jgi:hypothetical protein
MQHIRKFFVPLGAIAVLASTAAANPTACAVSGGWYCTNTGYLCQPMFGWGCVAVVACPDPE